MNSFGRNFRISIFGESHGEVLGVVMDGAPAGMPLSTVDFTPDLARRQSGDLVGGANSAGIDGADSAVNSGSSDNNGCTDSENVSGDRPRAIGITSRRESDTPEIVSGLFEGYTTGAPLTVLFRNGNTRSGDYARLVAHPRPSHADLVAMQKFGIRNAGSESEDTLPRGWNDPRGGGHFSGRVTLGLVAAGVVAKKILANNIANNAISGITPGPADTIANIGSTNSPASNTPPDLVIYSEIVEIGGSRERKRFEDIIIDAIREGDSVGGVIECRVAGVPTGLGEPFFDSFESVASHLLFSIPGVKGVEFGSGFAGAALRGSENNDPIIDARGTTATNNAGGVVGGITNGNEIMLRVAVKPTASIARPQQTYNLATGSIKALEIGGRHDACIALRAAVVVESAVAITLADLALSR